MLINLRFLAMQGLSPGKLLGRFGIGSMAAGLSSSMPDGSYD